MQPKALAITLVLASLLGAVPAHARVYAVRRYHFPPRYHYVHPYHVHRGYFSFGFSRFYAPPPVYIAPQPVYVAPPVVYAPPPVVVAPPPVVLPPAENSAAYENEHAVAAEPAPAFIETNRRYHKHGDNEGLLDWVEGLLNGRPVRIYYDDFGRVKKQKWID